MLRGLTREDAARFSFLLATPVILAAGALKLGDLAGPLGDGIRPQVMFGSVLSGVGAYLSVRFLTRYLAHRSLRPFGVYCIAAGVAALVVFAIRVRTRGLHARWLGKACLILSRSSGRNVMELGKTLLLGAIAGVTIVLGLPIGRMRTPRLLLKRALALLPVGRAVAIGASQILALAPGVSRSGIATVTGLLRGLTREDAARFSFLLATPVILAAGALKLGDLAGPLGDGIRPQVVFGSVLSGVGAYLSVRFLTRYLAQRSLRPFGGYCIAAGAAALVVFAIR